MNNDIWIFHGSKSQFSSGVFETIEQAEKFIFKYRLTGVLTKYPVGKSVYDWACENDLFKPKKKSILKQTLSKNFLQQIRSIIIMKMVNKNKKTT